MPNTKTSFAKILIENARFITYLLIYIAMTYFLYDRIYITDSDELVSSGKFFNLWFLVSYIFGRLPWLLITINVCFVVFILKQFSGFRFQIYVVLFLNPFLITNSFDAFNKFSVCAFLAFIFARAQFKVRALVESYLIPVILTAMHPLFAVTAALINTRAITKFTIICVTFAILVLFGGLNLIAEEKLNLLSAHGTELAEMYDGNYKLKPLSPQISLLGVSVDLLASSRFLYYPAYLIKYNYFDIFLGAAMGSGLVSLIIGLWRKALFYELTCLFLLLTTAANIVGNMAVLYRHLIPIFVVFIYYCLRDKKEQSPQPTVIFNTGTV